MNNEFVTDLINEKRYEILSENCQYMSNSKKLQWYIEVDCSDDRYPAKPYIKVFDKHFLSGNSMCRIYIVNGVAEIVTKHSQTHRARPGFVYDHVNINDKFCEDMNKIMTLNYKGKNVWQRIRDEIIKSCISRNANITSLLTLYPPNFNTLLH